MIDEFTVRKIVREELLKIFANVERRPEVERLYDNLQDKMNGNVSAVRRLKENEAINALLSDLLEIIDDSADECSSCGDGDCADDLSLVFALFHSFISFV